MVLPCDPHWIRTDWKWWKYKLYLDLSVRYQEDHGFTLRSALDQNRLKMTEIWAIFRYDCPLSGRPWFYPAIHTGSEQTENDGKQAIDLYIDLSVDYQEDHCFTVIHTGSEQTENDRKQAIDLYIDLSVDYQEDHCFTLWSTLGKNRLKMTEIQAIYRSECPLSGRPWFYPAIHTGSV